MGFPTSRDFSSLFGVTDEDHEKWEQRHAAEQARRAKTGTVRQLVDQTAQQAIGLGQMMVQAKLYGREAYAAEDEYKQGHVEQTYVKDGVEVTQSVPKDQVQEARDAVPKRGSARTAESYRHDDEATDLMPDDDHQMD